LSIMERNRFRARGAPTGGLESQAGPPSQHAGQRVAVIPGRSEAEGKGIKLRDTVLLDPLPGPASRGG